MNTYVIKDEYGQTFEMSYDQFVKYMNDKVGYQPPIYTDRVAAHEAIEYNIYKEYNAIKKFMETTEQSKYTMARFKILGYMIKCIDADPVNGDWYDEGHMKELKDAGRMLYEAEGMRGMQDELVWLFVPKRFRREIDMAWDGIGEWRS